MPSAKFDISQADEVAKHLGVSLEKVSRRAILSTAIRVVNHITTWIIPQENPPPVDRGAYRAGWRAKPDPQGAEIRNTLPYSGVIEKGARAENIKVGRAMIDALEAWVRRKGIGNQAEARSIAWAIAMSMKKKGIFNHGSEGLRVLEKALKIVEKTFADELKREMGREFRK